MLPERGKSTKISVGGVNGFTQSQTPHRCMANHHDTGYKELFSYPELVRQLIEGFAPHEVAAMMDFATLKDHRENAKDIVFDEGGNDGFCHTQGSQRELHYAAV